MQTVKSSARYRKYCPLNHLFTLPRCQRMTAVTLSPALMKTRFFLLRNTTLTGPTAPTAPTATCPRPRAQTNTNRPPSVEDVSLAPAASLSVVSNHVWTLPVPYWNFSIMWMRFCFGRSLFTISPRCVPFVGFSFCGCLSCDIRYRSTF